MDINQLKSNWKNSGEAGYSQNDLAAMTKINHHPVLRKLRLQLIIESVLLTFVLFMYYDGFDGHLKPVYVNVLIASSIFLFILNDVIAFLIIQNPVREQNLKESVLKQLGLLKGISVFSMLSMVFYGSSLLVFFTSTIVFTDQKYMILGGIILTFIIMIFFSYRQWKHKIDVLTKISSEFLS